VLLLEAGEPVHLSKVERPHAHDILAASFDCRARAAVSRAGSCGLKAQGETRKDLYPPLRALMREAQGGPLARRAWAYYTIPYRSVTLLCSGNLVMIRPTSIASGPQVAAIDGVDDRRNIDFHSSQPAVKVAVAGRMAAIATISALSCCGVPPESNPAFR
jgi:hypothetical protein